MRIIHLNFTISICIVPGSWSEWHDLKCSVHCGPGTKERERLCQGESQWVDYACEGDEVDLVECEVQRECIAG